MPLIACKRCGAKVSDEFSYCTNCKSPIIRTQEKSERSKKSGRSRVPVFRESRTPETRTTPHHGLARWLLTPLETNTKSHKTRKDSCPNCGVRTDRDSKFCPICGNALTINVGDVLNSTFTVIRRAPSIFFPMFVELLLSGLLVLLTITPYLELVSSTATPSLMFAMLWRTILPQLLALIALGILVRPIVIGMYPSMVKNVVHGKRIDMTHALRRAVRKYPSLLVSNVLVAASVFLGIILLVVPGLIVSTWYYYTDSAIILEDRGALNGMSASYAFARNKKWETFIMLLVPSGITIVGSLLRRGGQILAANGLAIFLAISLTFGLIASVLGAVMSSYTYISYAMRKKVAT